MAGNPQSRRVLMLGASGKLGRMLRAIWPQPVGDTLDIIPVFRSDVAADGVRWAPGDPIGNLPRADVVLALWGVTAGDAAALAMNATLAQHAMDIAEATGAARVLHCSSAAVYRPAPFALTEEAETDPPGRYGLAKQDMERLVLARSTRVAQVLMRIGNVAGAESLFGNMRPGTPVSLHRFANGRAPVRSYIAPQTLARAIVALCDSEAPAGVINVAAPVPTGMDEIARAAGCSIEWRDAPPHAVPMVALDTSRLQVVCPMSRADADAGWLVRAARETGCWP